MWKLFQILTTSFMISLFSGCDSNSDPVTKLSHLHGLPETQVVSQLGEPEHTTEFRIGETGDELRIELLKFYPPSDPANHDVKIRELIWKEGEYFVAVWFHKSDGEWTALDSARWHEDIQF